jgi:putative transposase
LIESFNARLREELLDGEIFYSLRETEVVSESGRRHHNEVRPHPWLGCQAPGPEAIVPALAMATAAAGRPER